MLMLMLEVELMWGSGRRCHWLMSRLFFVLLNNAYTIQVLPGMPMPGGGPGDVRAHVDHHRQEVGGDDGHGHQGAEEVVDAPQGEDAREVRDGGQRDADNVPKMHE